MTEHSCFLSLNRPCTLSWLSTARTKRYLLPLGPPALRLVCARDPTSRRGCGYRDHARVRAADSRGHHFDAIEKIVPQVACADSSMPASRNLLSDGGPKQRGWYRASKPGHLIILLQDKVNGAGTLHRRLGWLQPSYSGIHLGDRGPPGTRDLVPGSEHPAGQSACSTENQAS